MIENKQQHSIRIGRSSRLRKFFVRGLHRYQEFAQRHIPIAHPASRGLKQSKSVGQRQRKARRHDRLRHVMPRPRRLQD
jgi:hypothetical protein